MTKIALVVLDTLRKDYFDKYFKWLPGIRFDNAYTTANWTVPAHASLFTGLYPSEVGTHAKHNVFDYPEECLPEILSSAGYSTRAFSANTNITGHFNFDRGFDEFISPSRMAHLTDENRVNWRKFSNESRESGIYKYTKAISRCFEGDVNTVKSIVDGIRVALEQGGTKSGVKYGGTLEAISELEGTTLSQKEFFFFNLMEAHEPYEVPKDYKTTENIDQTKAVGDLIYGHSDRKNLIQAYDDCSQYLSDIYKSLFEILIDKFDYVLTLSDHGEMLGEHEMWGHEYGVFPSLVHVPLVVSGSEVKDQTRKDPVTLIDIYQTVLELAEIGMDGSRRGQSLFDESDERKFLTEYTGLTPWSEDILKDNGYAQKIDTYDDERYGIFTGTEYHYESLDGIINSEAEATQDVEAELATLVNNLNKRDVSGTVIPDEVEDQLKDLGYA
ncbi:hypothetical protein Harman_33280 [Haloarcula mannanilytica]|uniref:Sulfatase N-terminal domain-containing protein n=1 Tax=Haloarcula mannanilytica TaxID=2509225 RepID=A0A4C2ES42_9EURY|nr:sulfatase-like hydrolase/transferase [Haloarcula mannanilytica]GCF15393.1 hypothetical protein Harman_33280 [Haloarcula mannanilytica]